MFINDKILICIIIPIFLLFVAIMASKSYFNKWEGVHFEPKYNGAYIKLTYFSFILCFFLFILAKTTIYNKFYIVTLSAVFTSVIVDIVRNSKIK